MDKNYPLLRIAVASSCPDPWGGSEELWSGAAVGLAGAGHSVAAWKVRLVPEHPKMRALAAAGCALHDLSKPPPLARRLGNRLRPQARQYSRASLEAAALARGLRAFGPALVVVAQGSNFDGMHLAAVCRAGGWPYVLVQQKAVEFFWPMTADRAPFRALYGGARGCFFVSEHNRACTERQLGQRLPGAAVVRNPLNVPAGPPLPWPADAGGTVDMACVARLSLLDKGHDLLLQVLAQDQWRRRPWRLTCYGRGDDEAAIRELAQLLELPQVALAGHVPDVAALWARHPLLVLPSRSEGLPLALMEAMRCGRPAVATAAGGLAEALLDNETGFLAAAPTVGALAEALERAWQQRARWPAMGQAAARRVADLVPTDPVADFTQRLLRLASSPPTFSAP